MINSLSKDVAQNRALKDQEVNTNTKSVVLFTE